MYYKATMPASCLQCMIPVSAEPLLRLSFERIGRLKCKDGLNLQTSKVGWFALVGSTLHAYLEDSKGEEIHLRKLHELCEWNMETQMHGYNTNRGNYFEWQWLIESMSLSIMCLCLTAIQQDNEVLVLVEKGRWEERITLDF